MAVRLPQPGAPQSAPAPISSTSALPAAEIAPLGTTYNRLLEVEDLPDSLWNAVDEYLILPPVLTDAYRKSIAYHNLESLALSRQPGDSPVGGESAAESDEHFAQAFSGSVARAELAALDPANEVVHVSDAFARMLAGGRVLILDAPSGAAAVTLALLTTVAELRARAVLPRMPLDVVMVGGEFAARAREHAQWLIEDVRPFLSEQAIELDATLVHWDACDRMSTTRLIQESLSRYSASTKRLVTVANVNGFLVKESKQQVATKQLEELFRFSSGPNSTAIWIEPQTNAAVASGGLLRRFVGLITEKWTRFATLREPDGAPARTEARFRHPIADQRFPRVRLAVIRFDLGGRRA